MRPINNEKGAVLVVALIIMGVLAVIGTAIIITSSIELNIAQNEKVAKTAFNRAENGRVLAAMVSEAAAWGIDYSDGDEFEVAGSDVFVLDGDFIMEPFDLDPGAPVDLVEVSPDVRVDEQGALSANLDIDKQSTSLLPGASAEFGSGYEGAGAAGGMATTIMVTSIGSEPSGATARVEVFYLLIPK
ncbi:MAG: pilus assembly PilX N-terminal domain-containing protein [Deltaproteobacteria bacterium]|nr:pilus assembly PilX N-terminal domain-containing protein [Deltaproteobacteria bacterium]